MSQANSKAQTLFQKIYASHVVGKLNPSTDLLYVDRHLIHEVTSPQAFSGLKLANRRVRRPDLTFATMDHNVSTQRRSLDAAGETSRKQLEALAANCAENRIPLLDLTHPDQGIVHVIGPEQGLTQPGMIIVCGDSHTSTHGAFGALAFGIGTSEVEHVLATQTLPQQQAKTLKVEINGELSAHVTPKDVILAVIGKLGTAGGNGYVAEFCGSAIRAMSMEGRMTLCNMSIEMGGRCGLIAPDETTFNYIKGRTFAPAGEAWDNGLAHWKTLFSDADAIFDKEININAADIEPMITYGTNPGMGISVNETIPTAATINENDKSGLSKSLAYMGLQEGTPIKGQKVDYVFIGSCTNSRIEDLRMVASFVKGKKKAEEKKNPGSFCVASGCTRPIHEHCVEKKFCYTHALIKEKCVQCNKNNRRGGGSLYCAICVNV